jgi:replicative DNA helicase
VQSKAAVITQSAAVDSVLEAAREASANPNAEIGLPFGKDFPKLNEVTGGVRFSGKNRVSFLAARPGIGKSALAGKWAYGVAEGILERGMEKVVRIVTLEMDVNEYLIRLAAAMVGVTDKQVEKGLDGNRMHEFEGAMNYLRLLPIEYLDGTSGEVGINEIEAFIRRGGNCAWWIVDPLSYIGGIDERYGSQDLKGIVKRLAALARTTAPCLLVHHLNRETDKLNGPPTMANIAGSDFINAVASIVMTLYYPDGVLVSEDQANDVRSGVLEFIKFRSGPLGTKIQMTFDPAILDWGEDHSANRKATK